MKLKSTATLSAVAASALFAGSTCLSLAQDKTEKKEAAAAEVKEASKKTEAKGEKKADGKKAEAKPDVTLEVEGNDAMQMNVKALEAKAGQTVKLVLKHTGKLPKAAMGHNLVVVKEGTDLTKFAAACIKAGAANDYVDDKSDAIIAKTGMAGGGETTEVVFKIEKAGKYPFLCTFPGHNILMQGVLTVK